MKRMLLMIITIFMISYISSFSASKSETDIEMQINQIIQKMTIDEKIGQMTQRHGSDGNHEAVRNGAIGSILNEVDTRKVNEIQRIAVEESRLGIPLIFGRDVIHGFRTIFPIPLGLAATWNVELIEQGSRIAAIEAASVGVDWTFAPMMDIARDPRWGRVAESFGEDPYLASEFAAAMVKGFQTNDLSQPDVIAACAKHFACYGAAEGGRDYNTAAVPENVMRDVYLKPFKASVDAGVATFMTAFNEINGVPASGNTFLLKQILRDEWKFKGFVVSDWASITQMIPHGFCEDDKDAALKSILAGLDMEMASTTYQDHIKTLLAEKKINVQAIDDAVRNILRIKIKLGLFENPYTDPSKFPKLVNEKNLEAAKKTALQSIVLLQNKNNVLPLSKKLKNIAVVGPLADDPYEQLGTWTFDKNIEDTQTPLKAIQDFLGKSANINYLKTLETSRSRDTKDVTKAVEISQQSDAVLLFMGEEAILSGEAHCRANIDLPGAQEQLIETIHQTGKPVILTIIAGRPLTLGNILDKVDAILFAFHPGTMGGPALVDLIFGVESPSGKLPITFPKAVGQIPIYYNHKNTGRPPNENSFVQMDKIPVRIFQTSLGNESHYLDIGFKPQYPFGYGLSYSQFEYSNVVLSSPKIKLGETIDISATIKNIGTVEAEEVVQLFARDLVADRTRPVKELKGFKRIRLKPGQTKTVQFMLHTDDLAFYNQKMECVTEPGKFHVWIAQDSENGLMGEFEVIK